MPSRRIVILVLLAIIVALGVANLAKRMISSRAAAMAARQNRQRPAVIIAPAPAPDSLPLVGPDGVDTDGYPLRFVDPAGLRSLLFHRRFLDLTRYFEAYQEKFEADPRYEYWPTGAADTFDSAEPELIPLLDEWCNASPGSFAPFLARGAHGVAVGWAMRGGAWAADTPDEDFDAMSRALKKAAKDLDRARSLRPRLIAAQRYLFNIQMLEGRSPRRVFEDSIRICPTCFRFRIAYINSLEPRWGGSHAAMREFAEAAGTFGNPKLKLLAGYVDLDKAHDAKNAGRLDEALKAIERACAIGEHWPFLTMRAEIQAERGDLQAAAADADRAVAIRPGESSVLFTRTEVHLLAKRFESAAADYLAGVRIKPTHSDARRLHLSVVKGVVHEAWSYHTAGRRADALRCIDLASELAPDDGYVKSRQWAIVKGGQTDIDTLRADVAAEPNSFHAAQRLDYALAGQKRFSEIIEIWDRYLERQPLDGRAHLERSGTLHHLDRPKESREAAKRACELGNSEGCARVRKIASQSQAE